MEQKDVIVIGAGLTGLTVAHYLNKAGVGFHVYEQMDRHGGAISSGSENGFHFENGPNTGVVGSAELVDLFDELKEYCEIEMANEAVNKRYILKNGRWEKLPSGIMEGIKTNLFTTRDKFRILGEPFRKRGKNPHETLEELVLRRMGKSFLEYAVDPFILGVYAGDPAYLVPKYALPKLYNLEQNFGSFIGGSIKKSFQTKSIDEKKISRKVFSVKGGLSNLTNALYTSAGFKNFSFGVSGLTVKTDNEMFVVSGVCNKNHFEIHAKQVITTTGSHALPVLLPFLSTDQLFPLTNLTYAKVIEIVLGFHNWRGRPLDGFGGLIPYRENRNILGYLFLSSFLQNRAPTGGALLTLFMGGVRKHELFNLDDVQIMNIIKQETMDLMKLPDFSPDLIKINRYEHAIPQYGIESGNRFETVEMLQTKYKGLQLGGNLRNGIGMADRIKQGKELATKAIQQVD